MKKEKRDEIFRKLNEEYVGRKVILSSGQIGKIVKVTRANGFCDAVAFDVEIDNTIYDIWRSAIDGISYKEQK